MSKRKRLFDILTNMNELEIMEVHNHRYEGCDEEICDNSDYYWDNCNESSSTLMHMVDDGDIDLSHEYVTWRDNTFHTFNEGDVPEYVNIPSLADWLLEDESRLEELGIKLDITYADIVQKLSKIISGLAKIFPSLENREFDSVRYNLKNQVSDLTELQKAINEKIEEEAR